MILFLITLMGLAAAYLFSWWAIPFVAFLVCAARGKKWGDVIWQSTIAGAFITAILLAITAISYGFDRFDPLAQVIMLPSGLVMALITVLIGGILAGLGGAAGYSLRTISKKRRR
jgi:hypothetical protein